MVGDKIEDLEKIAKVLGVEFDPTDFEEKNNDSDYFDIESKSSNKVLDKKEEENKINDENILNKNNSKKLKNNKKYLKQKKNKNKKNKKSNKKSTIKNYAKLYENIKNKTKIEDENNNSDSENELCVEENTDSEEVCNFDILSIFSKI